jgi:steroid delta-isomerase-like uncharacterized protein
MPRRIVVVCAVLLVALGVGSIRAPGRATPAAAQEASPAAGTACPATSEDEIAALARRFAEERYVTPASLQDLLAPEVVYHRSFGTDLVTAAQAQKDLKDFNTAFPDVLAKVQLVTAKGDTATVVWTGEGTNQGEFQGVPPTGRRATWEGISVLRFACGRIVEVWNQTDGLGLLHQLSIITDEEMAGAEPSEAATPTP